MIKPETSLFRHEYGKLVAMLVHKFGSHHFSLVEDAVQDAMLKAVTTWPQQSKPDNPAAWLYQVAYRQCLTTLEKQKRQNQLLGQHAPFDSEVYSDHESPLARELTDSLLRMLFVCCNEAIALESQLVFTLKALCGFDIREVAIRLLITEDNAYKRYNRAKQKLQQHDLQFENIDNTELRHRLGNVHKVLYALFTEGYLSSHEDTAIRKNLCEESIRLTTMLSQNSLGDQPSTLALLALMHLHFARLPSRENENGSLVLLEHQNRSNWQTQHIHHGLSLLESAATGGTLSRFHVEASIAALHCLAPSFAQTDWQKVVEAYQLLERIAPSPMHTLNKAVALAQWQGAEVGLAHLQKTAPPTWLEKSYHWYAVLADLHFRCGQQASGLANANQALDRAPSKHIKHLLVQRFQTYGVTPRSL